MRREKKVIFEDSVDFRSWSPQLFNHKVKLPELENDPQAPQGLAALLDRTIVRASYIVGETVSGLRRVLDYTPRESVETQASEGAEYVARKLTNW